eukprot:TRINITY_DN15947_c0_g2_i1.p1 TRINITY_DN15947_c0_g2~~TRINITY_DN15947_c0_g2_i1.p1  ORF type:complete len:523 (-),score=79.24 TRINITY_DN15947_c0_g2_i1:176-1744(-)
MANRLPRTRTAPRLQTADENSQRGAANVMPLFVPEEQKGAANMESQIKARVVLDMEGKDPEFWARLLRTDEDVLAFFGKSLRAKLQRDDRLARQVIAASKASAALSSTQQPTQQPHEEEPACDSPLGYITRRIRRALTPSRSDNSQLEADCCISPGPAKRPRLSVAPTDRASPSKGVQAAPVSFQQRVASLAASCWNTSHTAVAHTPSHTPGHLTHTIAPCGCYVVLRRPAQGCRAAAAPVMPLPRELLPPLPQPLVAESISHLSYRDTMRLRFTCRGAAIVLATREAWEPMILDQDECAALLRHIRLKDILGSKPVAALGLPVGMFDVRKLHVDLMQADSAGLDDLHEIDFETVTYLPNTILDPLEEIHRHIRKKFKNVVNLKVSNIEDHRMDYRFLGLRAGVLQSYPHVRLLRDGDRPKYTLLARKDCALATSLDSRAALATSRGRRPEDLHQVHVLPDASQAMTSEEALFVQEHTAIFKNGDNFCVAHAPWRTYAAAKVNDRYRTTMQRLAAAAGPAQS